MNFKSWDEIRNQLPEEDKQRVEILLTSLLVKVTRKPGRASKKREAKELPKSKKSLIQSDKELKSKKKLDWSWVGALAHLNEKFPTTKAKKSYMRKLMLDAALD